MGVAESVVGFEGTVVDVVETAVGLDGTIVGVVQTLCLEETIVGVTRGVIRLAFVEWGSMYLIFNRKEALYSLSLVGLRTDLLFALLLVGFGRTTVS